MSEAAALAEEAFVFGLPLVYVALQVETSSNVAKPGTGRAPLNQFAHFRELPDSSDQVVVGLNVDTLYSLASLDLLDGPLVLSVPEMGGRYWLMQLIDAWNNVLHVPGTRTVGDGGGDFVIVGPTWTGTLPEGVTELRIPSNLAVIGGRTSVSGPEDYAAVHTLQDQYRLVPLQAWGTDWAPPAEVSVAPGVDVKTPVPRQVMAMTAATFFGRLNALLSTNPPCAEDAPVMERIARLGIAPGAEFPWASFEPGLQQALSEGVNAGKQAVRAEEAHLGDNVNGWQIALDLGRYGTRYTYRAAWTFFGVGGNLIEDACYPLAVTDGQGEPLDSSHRYTLHFDANQIPPVDAFWSLTLYDSESLPRGERDPPSRTGRPQRPHLCRRRLAHALHIQSEHPEASMVTNWLPAPNEGRFKQKLALRLYSPKSEVAQGTWKPPPIERVD